jgi:ribonuclease J
LGKQDVLGLIGDSTNVFSDGESGSELTVRDNLTRLIGRFTGRVAVACFASNVARLDSIVRAAAANGRTVALVGASLWRIAETARRTGYLSSDLKFYEADEASHLPRENVLYICTGSQGEGRAALMRIAFDQHPAVALEAGDAVIYSSRIIPGNERAVHKVQNQLVRNGIEVVTWRDEMIHVSGHPARDELRRMYGLVRPRVALPVHGELLHMKAHAKLAEECQVPLTVVAENGQAVRFTSDGAAVAGRVESGRLAWLDNRVVSLSDAMMKERKRVYYDGAVSVALVLDDAGTVLDDPQVATFGVSNPLSDDRDWADLIDSAVNRLPKKARRDVVVVEEAVRAAVRKAFTALDKKPVVKVQISVV